MLRTTLAGLRAHLLRLVLTGVVIILSVGFTAGTLVLTDSLDRAGTSAITATAADADLSVQSPAGAEDYLPGSLVQDVADVPGVEALAARRAVSVRGVDAGGRIDPYAVGQVNAVPDDAGLAALTVTDGRLPRADDEAVLDARTADRTDTAVGDTFAVAPFEGDPVEFVVVGIAEPDAGAGSADATQLSTTFTATQQFADAPGATRVDVRLEPGADADQVRTELAAATGTEVITGAELADRLVASSSSLAKELRVPLLMLGAVALIVAAFVIANTFRILVAQRTRDLALLRTVGATRGQVMASVLLESGLVGLVGAVLGVVLGAVAAFGVGSVIDTGGDLPLVVAGSTIVASLVVGLAVTVGAALLPARMATRVAPLAAVRALPEAADDARAGRVRRIAGILLTVGGALVVVLGAVSGRSGMMLGLVGVVFGAAVCFLGLLVLGPVYVPPLLRLLGRLAARLAGPARATAELATANSARHPKRVAATSAALLIGVTMVAGFATVAASARSSAVDLADEQFPADFTLVSSSEDGVPQAAVDAVAATPEAGVVVPLQERWALVAEVGTELRVTGIDLDAYQEMAQLHGSGDLASVAAGDVAVDAETSAEDGIGVGDTITVTPGEETTTLRVGYVIEDGSLPVEGVVVDLDTFEALFADGAAPGRVAVDAAEGVDATDARAAIVAATASWPEVSVQSVAESRQDLTEGLDQAVTVVLAVLGLAVVIAVIGIANTLSLSVHERTREIGLLRALGLTRGQTRLMLAIEALLMSVVAGLLGAVVGVAFAWGAVTSIADLGTNVPWAQIGLSVVVAALLGLLASVLPGRRAARTSPVVALATE